MQVLRNLCLNVLNGLNFEIKHCKNSFLLELGVWVIKLCTCILLYLFWTPCILFLMKVQFY